MTTRQKSKKYSAPIAEYIELRGIHLLVKLSADAAFEDYEDGGEVSPG